jgi:hypothetical protein
MLRDMRGAVFQERGIQVLGSVRAGIKASRQQNHEDEQHLVALGVRPDAPTHDRRRAFFTFDVPAMKRAPRSAAINW